MSPETPDIDARHSGRARHRRVLTALLAVAGASGCDTYRIEYHHRPGYYEAAAVGEQPDRVTLEDGTVLVFRPRDAKSELKRESSGQGGERFQVREELEDGTIVLRALLPEHVLTNTLTCLRNQEYELLWEQMIAERTKRAYELRGQNYEDYERFFSANRNELAATLTRMMLGLSRQESFMENIGGGVIRFRLHPRIATNFRFKTVDVVAQADGLKLLMIK